LPYFELQKDEFKLPPAYFADIDGLLAVGGKISAENLLKAYGEGAYYWHHPLKRIQWWSPDPRIVLFPESYPWDEQAYKQLSGKYELSVNLNFENLLRLCQEYYNRETQMGPQWLSERMFRIFMELHRQGYIQSIEVWDQGELAGGIFGATIEKLFFGEYLVGTSDAVMNFAVNSLIKKLCEKGYKLMDMQKETVFFQGIPYEEMARLTYVSICKENAMAISNQAFKPRDLI